MLMQEEILFIPADAPGPLSFGIRSLAEEEESHPIPALFLKCKITVGLLWRGAGSHCTSHVQGL